MCSNVNQVSLKNILHQSQNLGSIILAENIERYRYAKTWNFEHLLGT